MLDNSSRRCLKAFRMINTGRNHKLVNRHCNWELAEHAVDNTPCYAMKILLVNIHVMVDRTVETSGGCTEEHILSILLEDSVGTLKEELFFNNVDA